MSQTKGWSCRYQEWVFGAVSVGAFLIIVGALFASTPTLFDEIIKFTQSIEIVQVPGLEIPLIAVLGSRDMLYSAVVIFEYVWGFFQIGILVFRFIACSPLDKKGEAVSNIVFAFGSGYAVQTLLITPPSIGPVQWYGFWSIILIIGGVSLIARGIYLAIAGHVKYQVFH